jgi:hypothetical protein
MFSRDNEIESLNWTKITDVCNTSLCLYTFNHMMKARAEIKNNIIDLVTRTLIILDKILTSNKDFVAYYS